MLRRALAAAVLVVAVGATLPAASASSPSSPSSPPAGAPARIRFEPLGPLPGGLTASGVGSYRGAIELVASGGGVAVLNDVDFEDYVRGIAEVPGSWPLEALKAQAVAARTYGLWELLTARSSPWKATGAQVCATDSCQVYRGLAREAQPGGDRWSAAVDATRSQVLLYRGGVISAKYSSSNGGRSMPGGAAWLPSIADPDDAASPLHKWRWDVPVTSMAAVFGIAAPSLLVGLGRNGNTITATVQAPDASTSTQSLDVTAFRSRVNGSIPTPAGLPKTLPSFNFTVAIEGDRAVVDGGGWGHGLGMSQYGALGKAQRGWRAEQILAAYYGGIRPVVLGPGRIPSSIRVAVALGRPSVAVSANGPFRVVDERGHVLATSTTGTWTVTSSGRGLRAVGPPPPPPPAPVAAPAPPAPAPAPVAAPAPPPAPVAPIAPIAAPAPAAVAPPAADLPGLATADGGAPAPDPAVTTVAAVLVVADLVALAAIRRRRRNRRSPDTSAPSPTRRGRWPGTRRALPDPTGARSA